MSKDWNKLVDKINTLDKDREIESLKKQLASKDKLIKTLAQKKESKLKIKFNKPAKPKKVLSDHIRVIIPDSHGSAINIEAASAFLSDLKQLNPKEIVMLGDHVDCGGWLAQHHTLGYVAETLYSYEDDIKAANDFLDQIQLDATNAEIHYLEGNHEARIEKWAITQTLRHTRDSELLRRAIAPEFQLKLAERDIKYYSQGEFYNDLRIRGAIKLGKCHFWHGTSTAKQAATVNANQMGGNVVYGHTHRRDSHAASTVTGDYEAWCPGFLGKIQPYWCHSRPTGWTHGYGVQLVNYTGTFLHLNIPIIDGQSFLKPLLSIGTP